MEALSIHNQHVALDHMIRYVWYINAGHNNWTSNNVPLIKLAFTFAQCHCLETKWTQQSRLHNKMQHHYSYNWQCNIIAMKVLYADAVSIKAVTLQVRNVCITSAASTFILLLGSRYYFYTFIQSFTLGSTHDNWKQSQHKWCILSHSDNNLYTYKTQGRYSFGTDCCHVYMSSHTNYWQRFSLDLAAAVLDRTLCISHWCHCNNSLSFSSIGGQCWPIYVCLQQQHTAFSSLAYQTKAKQFSTKVNFNKFRTYIWQLWLLLLLP